MPETLAQAAPGTQSPDLPTGKIVAEARSADEPAENSGGLRLNWQIKAVLPIVFVLINGMVLFTLATVSWQNPQRHMVLVVAGAGAIAICAALVFVLTYTIQRPLIELQEQIAKLGDGDLKVSVSFAKREDEIGDLGRNFNRMVTQLRENREEIDRLHRTQMSRAEHLATLGELATGLAHEIRNPLAGIAGVIEIAARDLPSTSPAREVIQDIRQEISQINHIIGDLLQTARPHPPEIRRSDLNVTIEHSVMLARQQALSKPIEIIWKNNPDLPQVEHDSDQIHQVLLNLLLNAIQAIQGIGRIVVEAQAQEGVAAVSVSDTGKGIPMQELPNIFRPFYTTKGNGTGLGLSLARRITEEHHGRIEVTSTVGKGTRFTVLLPVDKRTSATVGA
jgi:signal transduction histidine kinase